jgi:hypothetical protein
VRNSEPQDVFFCLREPQKVVSVLSYPEDTMTDTATAAPADEAPAPYDQTLTLAGIRKHGPCEDGWRKLLAHLGKTRADDEPLTIATVYASNGFDDALWCLRAMPDDRLSRHFQAWCAEQVLHLFEAERPDDARVREQIAMLRNDAARDAARAAAWDAARAAARDAARAAAWDAAWDAARAAASDAARADAWAASRDAAWDAQERQFRRMIGLDQ